MPYIPIPQNKTIFGDRALKGMIKVKRSCGWTLIQYDWYPYKNKILEYQQHTN